MKIYLASSWRNLYQASTLMYLREAGHEVYDFKNPAPGKAGFGWRQTIDRPIVDALDLLEALAHPRAQEGFGFDFAAMKWADACVLLLPCGNSAHLEAGWFAGQGKPVAVHCPELREPELMYKCFDDKHGNTPLFAQVDTLLAHLAGLHTANRCVRCHHAAPNPNGCAACNPERLGERLRAALADADMLRAELAEHYPISIQAREIAAEGSDDKDDIAEDVESLRHSIDRIMNSTATARLEYLPPRLRKGVSHG